MQKLVHELQVHQLELEMQNDELRQTHLELAQARDRYADLYDFAPIAHLTLNARGDILEANLNAAELLGLERNRLLHQKFTRFVPENARDAYHYFCREVFRMDTRQSAELDLVNAQASRLVVQVEAVRDATDPKNRCRFSFSDITERKRAVDALKRSEDQYRDLFNTLIEGFCIIEMIFNARGKPVDYRFLEVNHVFEQQTGLRNAKGRLMRDLVPDNEAHWFEIYGRIALTGEPARFVNEARALGRWYDVSAYRVGGPESRKVAILFFDITEWKRAEERISQLNRVQTILAGIDRAIVHIPDRQKLLDEVCRIAVEKGGFKLAWVGMAAPDGSVRPVAQAGVTGYLKGISVVTHNVPKGRGPVGTAIRENRPAIIEDIGRDARMAPWLARARRFGLRYVAAFPIQIAGQVAGAFSVYAPKADFFDEKELGLLTQVSDDLSFALTAMADLAARKQAEEALRLSEERFKLIFDSVPTGIAFRTVHPDGSFTRSINDAYLRICGLTRRQHDQSEIQAKITHPDDLAVQQQFNDQVAAGAIKQFSMEKRYLHPGGKIVWANFAYQREVYPDGTIEELTTVVDLTGRKQMEDSLRRSEHNLSNFFSQAPIGLVWLSAGGTILRANLAQLDLLGFSAENYLGKSFIEFCGEPSQVLELLQRLAARETVRNFPMTRQCQDGTIRHVLVDANPVWSDNQFLYSSIFLRDITDRIELEKEILQVSEREHRRIAQDLHDGLGQLLVGTAYLTSSLREELAAKALPEARKLGRILKVQYEAIAQTRNLARGLHPVEPEPNGLMVALQALAVRTKKLFRVGCRFACRQPVLIQDNTVATHLFRIAQEAITNAIKHGKPGRIEICLTETPERINLAIKDNGAGIPARQRKKPGMGLRIMRYRAGMIGGSLAIQKEPGGGTAVVCSVHLPGAGALPPPPKAAWKKH